MKYLRQFVILFFIISISYSQDIRINEVSSSNSMFYDEDGDTPDWIELYNPGADEVLLNNWSLSDVENDNNPWTFPDITLDADEYLLIWASDKDRSNINFIRTLINEGDSFKFIIPDENTPLEWINNGFDDSSWNSGNSGFGYSDNDDNTLVPAGTLSVFVRKNFSIQDVSTINNLILDVDYDDAFVAYINGVEVARANITGVPPAYNSDGLYVDHEAQIYNGGIPDRFDIANAIPLLINGDNVLSIQVHNVSQTSSDMTLIPFLSAVFDVDTGEGIAPPQILNLSQDSPLHTDFKISSEGESVYLRDPDGNLIDSMDVQALPVNISAGISFGSGQLTIYDLPTPGEENDTTEFEGVFGNELLFSHDGGNLNQSISLEITGNGDGEIRYTTDFTEPTETSQLYTGPININQTTIVRAKAFKENYISLHSYTRNYFFGIQSDLPIMHLVTDEYNLFDYDYGIYAYGPDDYGGYPYFGANFWEDWERPVHISYYQDNTLQFNSNAGIKIFGAYSRGWDQKSLALFARGEYGNGEFEFPFFDNLEYDEFESLVLRNSGNDWMRTNMRDAAITSLMDGSHIDFQSFKTVSTYINEDYWGLYNLREKVSENLVASKHDVNPNEVTMLTNNAEIVDGDNAEFLALRQFFYQNDLSQTENYNYVIDQIDIENFMEYHIAQIYMDNRDYPGNNIKYWKVPGKKWRWILYDTDFGFAGQWWSDWDQNYAHTFNTLDFVISGQQTTWANPDWATLFLRKLVQNIEFRNLFINRYADEMNTRYLATNVTSHFLSIYDNMYNEMLNHIDRWIDSEPWVNTGTVYQFVDNMNNFAINRQPFAKSHILEEFNLNDYHEVTLFNETPNFGFIILNDNLKIQEDEWSGDYFEDVPISLYAIAESGYEFSHWSGLIDSTSQQIQVNINDNSEIQAHFVPSSGLNLVINEINYKSPDDFDTGDWIELYNPNPDDIDISGWVLKDNNDSNQFVFPQNTTIQGNGYLVVVRNSEDFTSFYPEISSIIGEFDFGLSSSGDSVRLFNSDLIIHDEVNYGVTSPWPDLPNGGGYTLELIDPNLDNLLPESWSNINFHGSPNAINSATASINEESELFTRIYPNPVVSNLYFIIEQKNTEITEIKITDLNGRLVKTVFKGNLVSGVHRFTENLSMLSSGIYILNFSTTSGLNQSHKLVKF